MKPRRIFSAARLSFPLAAALVALLAAPSAFAQGPYYWDNLAGAGFGAAGGTWSSAGTANKWNTSNTGADAGLQASLTTTTAHALNFGTGTTGNGLGAGTITVSGTVNAASLTYGSQSGNIVLSGGTINLAAAATITTNASTHTIASLITGATTSLTKAGANILRITGANSAIVGGNLNLNAGELQVGTSAEALGGSDGWTVQLGNTSGTSGANLSLGNSLSLANPITVRTGSSGTKTLGTYSGSVTASFTGVITANDSLTVLHDVAGSGSITVSNAGNTVASGETVTFSLATLATLTDSSTWSGAGKLAYSGSGDGTINVTGAKTHSGGSTLGSMSGDGVVVINTSSTGPANTPTNGPFGTGTLTLGATKVRATTSGDRTVGNSITFSGNPTFSTLASEKSLVFTGNASLGATRILTVETGSTDVSKFVEFQGAISGSTFGITKAGAGVLTLSGANSYTGSTTVSAGTLRLANTDAVADSSAVAMNTASGSLILGTDSAFTTFPSLTGASGAFTYTLVSDRATPGAGLTHGLGSANFGNATFSFTSGSNVTSGTAGITFTGSPTLGGGSAGTVTLAPTTATLTLPGLTATNAAKTLVLDGTGTGFINGVISPGSVGITALNKSNTSTWTLSGLNTFAGNVTVSGGILATGVTGNGTASALGTVTASRTISVDTGGTLRVDSPNVFHPTFSTPATSLPVLDIAGGTMTNGGSAANSALGNMTLAGGTLSATTGSPIGTGMSGEGWGSWNLNGTVTSTGNSTISSTAPGGIPITLSATATNGYVTTFDVQSGTLTASAVFGDVTRVGNETVSGLAKTGAGTMVLSGINTYTGNTAINAGTLNIATKDALPGYSVNGRYSVAAGATLAVQNGVLDSEVTAILGTANFASGANLGFDTTAGSRNVPLNLANTASGPLGIVKLGANTLTLSGTNTYSGGTTVLAGALYLGGTSSLPNWNVNGGFSLASGASLIIPNTVSEAEVTTMLGTTNIATGAILSFDTGLGDRLYTSAVTNSAQGLLNIGKIGDNALTFAGTNTYTGNTTVTSGTLNITGSLTGLAASSNLAYGNTPGNTVVNISGSVSDYKNFQGANNAGSVAVMNQTGGSASTLGTNGQDTQWVAQNGGYGYLNITGGTFNTGRFDAVGATGGGTAVVYVGGTGTFNNNSGDWLILPRKTGIGQLTVGPGGNLVRTAAVTAQLGITMDGSNAHGELNIAGGNVDTGVRAIQFGFGSPAYTGTRGFVNLAGGTLSVGSAISQINASGQYFDHFNFAGGTLKSNAAMTWLPASSATGHAITATIYGPVTNNNNANAAFNTQLGTSSNFPGGLTVDTNNFETTIAYPLAGAGGVGVTQADIGDVSLLGGNSGYIGAPAVVFSAPASPTGVPASGYAVIDAGTGKVNGIVITNPGTYAASETPTITLTGGGGAIAPFNTAALSTANTSGGLTKTGAGVLTLSGASTYTGVTSVDAGTLNFTGTLTSSVTVASNAALRGEGSTTGVLAFSGTCEFGFDPGTLGTYLTAASANATGASVNIIPTAPVTGTGLVVLNAPGGITGTAGGPGNNFAYTGRGSLTLNVGNTQLLLDAAPANLAWRGNDGTNPTFWDLNGTTNWDSGVAEKFLTNDGVTFDDTATSFVVDINAGNVFPGNITFNNSANSYTIQGAFGIYGGGTLTKGGTGTTVINTANGYTGATTVTAGALNIRNASALGDVIAGTSVASGAALEIQGGITTVAEALTLNGSGVLGGGALRGISGDNTWGAPVALASASTIGVDADTLTLPRLTGAFALTKVGAGTLNITGTTAVTSTTVEAGTLYMGAQTGASTTATLGAASAVTLNGSSNLTIRRTNTGAVDLMGAIGGTGSLTLLGDNVNTLISGDFNMNNASTYAGGTTITGARANVSTATSLGSGLVTTGTNGQVWVSAASLTLANNFAIGGLGWNGSSGVLGVLRLNATTLTGDITLTSNARITGEGSSALSGKISGGFGLEFFEDTVIGTIALSGNNDYTGETIVNSMGAAPATMPILVVANNNALGTTAGGTIVYGTGATSGAGSQLALANNVTVTGESLTLDSTAAGYRASLTTAASATAIWDGNVVLAGTGGLVGFFTGASSSLTVGSSDADTVTGTRTLTMRGTGTGTINSTLSMGTNGLTKTDAGDWTINSNNNDFTGTPSIANGILRVGSIADAGVNSALGSGTVISFGANSTATGTLQFTGTSGGSSNRSLTIANGTTGGAGAIENTVAGQTLALSGALTVATPASASALTLAGAGDGVLSGGIAGTPLMSLTKTGAGSWTISGTATYRAATSVTDGTLTFNAASVFDSATATGKFTVNGATAVANIAGTYNVAEGNGDAFVELRGGGTLNFNGTSTLTTVSTGGGIRIGEGSAGTMNMTAGTLSTNLTASSNFVVGRSTGGNGALNLSGGILTVTGAGGLLIANTAGNAGVVTVSGTGHLVMTSTGSVTLGPGTATINLNTGGTFTLGSAMNASGTSTINID